MSLDYPNRAEWLAKRHTPKRPGRVLVAMAPKLGNLKDPGYSHAHRRVKGFSPAHGPGSINVESDIRQLIESDRAKEAAAMYEAHHRIVGARPIKFWTRWYELYKAGDSLARGVM